VCLGTLALPALADQVVLKNGDRITGSVIKKDAKNLSFKTDAFGNITVPWDRVETLSIQKPVFVELPDGRPVPAVIDPHDGGIRVTTAEATHDSSVADLLAIRNAAEQEAYERLLNPTWTQLWAGTGTIGWAGVRGNARSLTFTAGLNAARVTSTDKTTIQFNAIRSSATVEGLQSATAEAIRGGWGYNRTFESRFTYNTFNDYETDRFQNLDLRFVLGGGLGFIVWKGERGRLDLQGGGAYNREAFSATDIDTRFSRNAGEAYTGDEFTFKLSPVTSFYQSSRTFFNLTQTGDFRVNFDIGTDTKLFRWLSWKLSLSDRYLSNPVPGRKKNDFLYSTGIGVTFAR
jgi:putative salt-induced outer membrane protein YdiY